MSLPLDGEYGYEVSVVHTDVDSLDIDLVENIGLLIQTTETLLTKYDVTLLGEEGEIDYTTGLPFGGEFPY